MHFYHIPPLAMIVLICGLEGCFRQVDERPDEWAPPEVRAELVDCSDISGHYQEQAAAGSGLGLLSVILFPESSIACSSIKISQRGDDYLHVTAYTSSGKIQTERSMSRDSGDFQCTSEGLVLKESIGRFWVISAMYGRGIHILNRTEDKSLVINTKGWVTAYHAFIPYSIRNVLWSRFEPYMSKGQIAPESEAQFQMYHTHAGLPSRLIWLCRSADQGYPFAQAEVGRIYSMGLFGIPMDLPRAYVWYGLATNTKPDLWKHEYLTIRESLTSKQLLQAETMRDDWKPGQCESQLVPADLGD